MRQKFPEYRNRSVATKNKLTQELKADRAQLANNKHVDEIDAIVQINKLTQRNDVLREEAEEWQKESLTHQNNGLDPKLIDADRYAIEVALGGKQSSLPNRPYSNFRAGKLYEAYRDQYPTIIISEI